MVARTFSLSTDRKTDHFYSVIHCTTIKVGTFLKQVLSIPLKSYCSPTITCKMASFNGARTGGWNTSQRNNPNLQRQYRDNSDESAFNNLHNLITQLTNREPNSHCDTLEEALRLMRDLPAENARIKQQLGMLGRDPAEPYGHGRMG